MKTPLLCFFALFSAIAHSEGSPSFYVGADAIYRKLSDIIPQHENQEKVELKLRAEEMASVVLTHKNQGVGLLLETDPQYGSRVEHTLTLYIAKKKEDHWPASFNRLFSFELDSSYKWREKFKMKVSEQGRSIRYDIEMVDKSKKLGSSLDTYYHTKFLCTIVVNAKKELTKLEYSGYSDLGKWNDYDWVQTTHYETYPDEDFVTDLVAPKLPNQFELVYRKGDAEWVPDPYHLNSRFSDGFYMRGADHYTVVSQGKVLYRLQGGQAQSNTLQSVYTEKGRIPLASESLWYQGQDATVWDTRANKVLAIFNTTPVKGRSGRVLRDADKKEIASFDPQKNDVSYQFKSPKGFVIAEVEPVTTWTGMTHSWKVTLYDPNAIDPRVMLLVIATYQKP